MKAASLVSVAAAAVTEHRVRSALGAIGVALAVAVSVASLGVNEGARRAARAEVDRLGIDTIVIAGPNGSLTIRDADVLRQRVREATAVSEVVVARRIAAGLVNSKVVDATGVSGEYELIRTVDLRLGRFINIADELAAARVCVIGDRLAFALTGRSAPGDHIRIGRDWFTVVGVLPSTSADAEALFVPASALLAQPASMNPSQPVTAVWMRIPGEPQPDLEDAIRGALAANPDAHKYTITAARDLLNARRRTQTIFLRTSAAAAFLLFVVGGAAIANALLSSVLERVPEIGVRRAVGAKRWHIGAQFIFEAAFISTAGVAAGMAAGVLLIALAAQRGWDVAMPATALFAVPVVAAVMALVAGTYPAMRAAAVDPIDALSRS